MHFTQDRENWKPVWFLHIEHRKSRQCSLDMLSRESYLDKILTTNLILNKEVLLKHFSQSVC